MHEEFWVESGVIVWLRRGAIAVRAIARVHGVDARCGISDRYGELRRHRGGYKQLGEGLNKGDWGELISE
jgi:hypothetical protein